MIAQLEVGPGTRDGVEMGPLVTREHRERVRGYVDSASTKARSSGRWPRVRSAGQRERFLPRRLSLRPRHARHAHLSRGDLRPRAVRRPRRPISPRHSSSSTRHEFGNGTAIFTRDGEAARSSATASRPAWSASTCRSPCPWRFTASAAGSARCSGAARARSRRRALLHAPEDGDLALAEERERAGVRDAHDALTRIGKGAGGGCQGSAGTLQAAVL